MKFKPNSKLPQGAKMFYRPIRFKTGSWSILWYDAWVMRSGVRWLRVKDGFGESGDREDWVADIPIGCLAVHDYNWNDAGFATNYGTFNKAIKAMTADTIKSLTLDLHKYEHHAKWAKFSIRLLEGSLK